MNELKEELVADIQRTFENIGEFITDPHLLQDAYSTQELANICNRLHDIYREF